MKIFITQVNSVRKSGQKVRIIEKENLNQPITLRIIEIENFNQSISLRIIKIEILNQPITYNN